MRNPSLVVLVLACLLSGCGESTDRRQAKNEVSAHSLNDRPTTVAAPQVNVGLTQPPDEYLKLNLTLSSVGTSEWNHAIQALTEQGDEFTLTLIDDVMQGELLAEQREELKSLSNAIHKSHDPNHLDAGNVRRFLETAAYADLMCHPLENKLRTWTLAHVRRFAESSEIRDELKSLRDEYHSNLGTETMFDAMDNRVPEYARQILRSADENE